MPTVKNTVSVVVSDEILNKIQDYQFNNRIKSQSKAIVELIELGLSKDADTSKKVVREFSKLNHVGQVLVLDDIDTRIKSGKYAIERS